MSYFAFVGGIEPPTIRLTAECSTSELHVTHPISPGPGIRKGNAHRTGRVITSARKGPFRREREGSDRGSEVSRAMVEIRPRARCDRRATKLPQLVILLLWRILNIEITAA